MQPDNYHNTPVREFHTVFGHPVEYTPTVPTPEQVVLRVKLIGEELAELADACGVRLRVDNTDVGNQVEVCAYRSEPTVDLVEVADALGDIRYLVDGGNLIFGIPGEAVLAEIHRSNMSKLGADGKPVRREDGKTLKGPNYTPPDIAQVLRDARNNAGLPPMPSEAGGQEYDALFDLIRGFGYTTRDQTHEIVEALGTRLLTAGDERRLRKLDALERGGVDNWEWYDEAMSTMENDDAA